MKKLGIVFFLVCVGCKPAPKKQPPVPDQPPPQNGDISSQLLSAHNAERARSGLKPLRINQQLSTAAQKHADWMAATRNMSHTGKNGSSFTDRISAEGYKYSMGGENIAFGYTSVASVLSGWMNSPGHRANIMNPRYVEAGFGMNSNYWCADFGTPRQAGVLTMNPIISEPPPLQNQE